MRRGKGHLLAALLLAGCAAPETATRTPDGALPAVVARATLVGGHLRAALACNLPVSVAAQDRAAAIEAAALRLHTQSGGTAARDAYLASLAPPAFDPRQQGRDRAAWCAGRRADILRVSGWLDGAEGAAFAERVEDAARF